MNKIRPYQVVGRASRFDGGRQRKGWIVITALSLLALLTACGGNGAPASDTEATSETDDVVFLTDFAFFGYTAPFFAGVEEGIFEEHGINLTIQPGENSVDTVTQVGAGSVPFGLADPLSVMEGINAGAPLTMIAAHWQSHVAGMCYVPGPNEPTEPADFASHTIAGNPEDAYEKILLELMARDGADSSEMVFEDMSNENATAALFAGRIDSHSCGLSTFAGRLINAEAEGFDLGLFLMADQGFDAIGHSIITRKDVIEEDSDLVQRFIQAYAESVVWSQENVDEAIAHYVNVNPDQDTEASKAAFLAPMKFAIDESFSGSPNEGQFTFPPEKIEETVDVSNDFYDLNVNLEDAYTNEFVEALSDELRSGDSLSLP